MKLQSLAGPLLLVLFATASTQTASGQPAAEPLTLHHEIRGQGAPLILLHGAFMSIETNWSASLDELAKSSQVIAVELQGHGRTPDRSGPLTYETMADDVANLMDTLDIEDASVLGYSMGGNVAMQFALRHPERLDRLVVISAAASDTGLAAGHKEMVQYLSPEMFSGTPIVSQYQALSPAPDFPALVEKIKQLELTPFDVTAELHKIEAPTLLIAGDADVVTLKHLAEMYAAFGGQSHGDINGLSKTQMLILPGTTHMGILADPAKAAMVSNAATTFLASRAGHQN